MKEKNLPDRQCPICDASSLSPSEYSRQLEHNGHSYLVDGFRKLECQNCGASITDASEARHNKRLITKFRKEKQGLLSGAHILAIRKTYSLTQKDAALLFGGGPIAFSKYENDEVTQSEPMDRLLRIAEFSYTTIQTLASLYGISLKSEFGNNKSYGRRRMDIRIPGLEPSDDMPTFGKLQKYRVSITADCCANDADQSAAA